MGDIRKSMIKKGVTRKLNTAKYETCDIFAEISQEVEWGSVEELMKKSENVGKLVLEDYQRFELKTLQELNLDSQNAVRNDGPTTKFKKDDFDSL